MTGVHRSWKMRAISAYVRGAALVEFAIVVLLLPTLVFPALFIVTLGPGVIQTGRAMGFIQ